MKYILPILFGISILGGLTYYKLNYGIRLMESDSASDICYAYLLSQQGGHILYNYFFSTALRIFDNEMLFALLFRLFPRLGWWEIETMGTAIMNGLMGLSSVLLAYQIGLGQKSLWMFGFSLLPYGWSEFYYVLMHGCGYYGYAAFQVYLILSLYLMLVQNNKKSKHQLRIGMLCFVIISLITGIQGIRLLENLFMPLLLCSAGLVLYQFTQNGDKYEFGQLMNCLKKREYGIGGKYLLFSLIGTFSATVGYIVNKLLLRKIFIWGEIENQQWKEISFEPIEMFIVEWFSNFGYIDGLEFFSKRGIINLISIALCIVVTTVLLKIYRKREIKENEFIIWFFGTAILVHIFVYTFLLRDYKARYMLPFFMILPHIVLMIIEEYRFDYKKIIVPTIITSVLLINLNIVWTGNEIGNNAGINVNKQKEMAKFLVDNNYQYGFSTFLYGNSTVQLSNGALEICVLESPQIFKKYEWLCTKDDIRYTWTDKVFFIVSDKQLEESGHMPWNQKEKVIWHDGGICVFEYESVRVFQDTFS